MKSKHIVVLCVATLWALASCVFEDELVMQDTPSVETEVAKLPPSPSSPPTPSPEAAQASLPGQYTVQIGDTLRDIAARAGIYWNGTRWSSLYNANRDKITNPDLILPGIVLTIPSLRDEVREGMWEASRDYENPFVGR
jgi:nucleoid-associated protein YgaU